MNKSLLLIVSILFTINQLTNAQSWQWGARGGSADSYGSGPDETVIDMATDPKGNVYVLSKVLQTSLSVAGHAVTGWGAQDILLTSFRCDGTYRWSKDIGGDNQDIPVAVRTDSLGGVYLVGYVFLNSSVCHISTDTTVAITNRTLLLVKYDTAGNYQWLRFPQASGVSASTLGKNFAYDMDVDGSGNIYVLSELSPGTFGGSYAVSTQGENMLEYDKLGNFISGSPMQITIVGTSATLLMKREKHGGKFFIAGSLNSGTLSFGGVPITHALFVGCFSSSGTFLWQKQDVLYGGGFARPDIDASGDVYLTAASSNGDTFNTYVVTNAYYGAPFTTKMDSNGNFKWAKNATTNAVSGCSSASGATSCSVLNGDELDISGSYPGRLKWNGYPDSLSGGGGYHIFVTRFNASGGILGLDSLISTGATTDATAMTGDKYGNFYVGGDFAVTLTVAGTTLNSIGGNSDFFIAKYGTANCSGLISLEAPPQPQFGTPAMAAIEVYPNPATGELTVAGLATPATYRLLGITGTALQQGELPAGSSTLSMPRCAPGLYLLELTGTDRSRQVIRVVKE